MARPRQALQDLKTTGYLDRMSEQELAARERGDESLTPQQKNEVTRLDALIEKAMDACEQGHVVGLADKRNPAFSNLILLLKARDMITKRRAPGESGSDTLAKANEFLREAGVN